MKDEADLLNFQQMSFVFDNMTEEVHFWRIIRDEQGGVKTWSLVYANKSALKTWGRESLEGVVGNTTDEIFGDGSTAHYMPVVNRLISEGQPLTFQDYFPNMEKHFRFTSLPLGDYFITTGWDITDLIKDNESLSRDNKNLKEHILYNAELEHKVRDRTEELERANLGLNENIEMLKSLLDAENETLAQKTVNISELIIKQSDLLKTNSRILAALVAAQDENSRLRLELENRQMHSDRSRDLSNENVFPL